MTKFYIDENGNYLGGFYKANPPEGSIEVPFAPDHAWQKYDIVNDVWLELTAEQKVVLGIE